MTTQQSVVLGPVTLRGFEVPEQIVFGGGQRVAVHELIGGGRVVDTLGAAAEEIVFAGVFSGPDAALRMQSLDAARAAGLVLPLSWGNFSYSVIITEFSSHYQKPWWVPYALRLVVVEDVVAVLASTLLQAGLDIASAGGFAGAVGVSLSGVNDQSLAGFGPASAGLAHVIGLAADQIESATTGLAITNVAQTGAAAVLQVVDASARQASAVAAQAYLGRAAANVGMVGP